MCSNENCALSVLREAVSHFVGPLSCLMAVAMTAAIIGCSRVEPPPIPAGVSLPHAEFAVESIKPWPCNVYLTATATGEVSVNGVAVPLEDLRRHLRPHSSDDAKRDMIFRFDRSCPLKVLSRAAKTVAEYGDVGWFFISVQSAAGNERVFYYGFPLQDGHVLHPWYAISPNSEEWLRAETEVFTRSHQPGYAAIWVKIRATDYEALNQRMNKTAVRDLLLRLKQKYPVLLVHVEPEKGMVVQRLVDAMDVCMSAGLKSYSFGSVE